MKVECGVDRTETFQTQLQLDRNPLSTTSSPPSTTSAPSTIPPQTNRPDAAKMELTIPEDDYSATRLRAIKDAIEMQDLAVRQCFDAGIETPPYKLTELIGKGSFGRVYKATATKLGRTVAVKIMSIEEGDCLAPGQSDTFAEIMKEVTTLRILGDGGAKNINKIIDSLLVGHSMWVVTEYCAGGSVATLMRPAGCLPESCIIPILREVAEAIYWVHKHGIIHRDLKCANVLITEEGGVQLCDFGVAGIVRSKLDKRSTITGTLQWMAPELFDSNVAYGNEVDIWAFGSMAYEAATGFPPNATTLLDMDLNRFGAYLRESCPRLEGDGYSDQLKDLISYCMVPDPAKRPRIEDVQKHPYLFDTATSFPTSSLKALVESYKKWEKKGGNRQSLFVPGGAQCHAGELSDPMDVKEWDYGTMDEADQFIFDHDQTGASSSLTKARPPLTRGQRRRRRLPANIRAVKSPLERVFDPNTLSNYQDQVKAFYKRSQAAAASPSVPLPTHEGALPPSDAVTSSEMKISQSPAQNGPPGKDDVSLPITPDNDLDTIKPPNRQSLSVDPGACPQLQPQLGTSRTQDWTFPSMTPTPTSDPNGQHSRTNSTTSTGSRRTRHRSSSSTFSIGGMDVAVSTSSQIGESPFPRRQHRADSSISSRISLIDLDASIVPFTPPNITINSGADEFPPSSHNRYTESFPEFSSPPTNGTSLPPLQSSPFLPPLSFEGLDSDLYSSVSTIQSPSSPNGYGYGNNYHRNSDLQPSPLLPSPPNENGPSLFRDIRLHHGRNDSGYYASSSVCGSLSRGRTRTNSSSQSLPPSCFATPQYVRSCPCPTIDQTLALDETPPRCRVHHTGQKETGFRQLGTPREPSLYLPCVEDEEDDRQIETEENGVGAERTDPGHRGLFLPRIILDSRTSGNETTEKPFVNSISHTGSPSRIANPKYDGVGMARRQFEGPGLGNMNGVEVGKGDYFGRTFTSGPALPEPPRADVMMGMASKEALKDELTRLLGSMADHLKHSGDLVMGLPAVGPPKLPKVANGNVVGPVGSGASVGRGSDSAPKKEA